jgi:hypothetical protein
MLYKRQSVDLLVLSVLALLITTRCAQSTVTTPATPANVQMAQLSKTLADAESTASKTLIALRNNGKIDEAETRTVQNYIVVAATTGKSMDAELVSADDWPTQKSKIIQMWVATGLGQAKASLSPTAGLVLDSIINVVNQILTALGAVQIITAIGGFAV